MLQKHKEPYIQQIRDDRLKDVQLFVKREDVIHPFISGNKWHKLKYNLSEAQKQSYDTLLTFGGAYSNHIYATAAAAREAGFSSIGIIRGDELKGQPLNRTLTFAREQGMRLEFVDRTAYRNKTDEVFVQRLHERFGPFYLIPEGGTNNLAISGCAEMVNDEVRTFDYICCSAGTGGTVSGLIAGMNSAGYVIGFAALKGDFLEKEVRKLLTGHSNAQLTNWEIQTRYHFGGYAKSHEQLKWFMQDFEQRHQVLLDPVYTGKMMYGVFDLIAEKYFPSGSKVLAIHTGGLQGR